MSFEDPRSYTTDDIDIDKDAHRLEISMGGNGDWYVSIIPKGHRASYHCVRVTTSGSRKPEVANAVADLYLAMEKGPLTGR